MSVIRVLVADDHPLVLKGICDFVGSQPGIDLVARCIDGEEALAAIRAMKPDVAVLDLTMPNLVGLEVLQAATTEQLPTRVMFLSAFVGTREIMSAMAEGAWGILVKDCAPDALLACIRKVAAGERHLPYELLARARDEESAGKGIPIEKLLTESEWLVAALAAQGLSNKQISRKLKIAEGTAKIHLHHVFRKLNINSRTALANITFRQAGDPRSR
jgi:two-component system nitrate/nitrite response regulator NarL